MASSPWALCMEQTRKSTLAASTPFPFQSVSLVDAQQRVCQLRMAYPDVVTATHSDTGFAQEAGERIEQAFALCAFASELVGKANEE